MSPDPSLRGKALADTLAELEQQVRAQPSELKHRVFLFQLLAILGQWDRALAQLDVAGELDGAALAMVQTYRAALQCEVLRTEIFAGRRMPLIFGDPESWIALQLEALRLSAEGHHAKAKELRDQAFAEAPATPGTIPPAQLGPHGETAPSDADQSTRFEWIADADVRLGPMLEAIVNGRYYWVPFHRIRTIEIDAPADLRDMVWMPARFEWANGGQSVGLIPTRYVGSEASEEDEIRLARRTEWQEHPADTWVGRGQRMLATDAGELPLMDVRRIDLEPAIQAGPPSPAEPTEIARG